MMKRKVIRRILLAAGLVVGLTRCVGTSAPPAPIAEIPSFLVFPESVSIGVDRIEAESSAGALKSAVAPGGEFSDLIAVQAQIAQETNRINDAVLSAVGGVAFAYATPIDHYDSTTDSSFTKENPIKIDFGDFDLNGDGAEGCSGCTCPFGCSAVELAASGGTCPTPANAASGQTERPICFRLWVDDGSTGNYERFLAGIFTEVPLDEDGDRVAETSGAGRYRVHVVSESDSGTMDGLLGVLYDHQDDADPLRKFTDLFMVNDIAETPDADPVLRTRTHVRTDQEAAFSGASAEDEVKKTLKIDYQLTDVFEEIFYEFVTSISQFRDDEDFWIGTIDGSAGLLAENQCVDLRTGNAAADAECQAIGISVAGETVSITVDSDVAFPPTEEFPLDPCDSQNLSDSTGC